MVLAMAKAKDWEGLRNLSEQKVITSLPRQYLWMRTIVLTENICAYYKGAQAALHRPCRGIRRRVH